MKQKPYIFIIEVTAKSPKGIKALNSKHKGVGIADVPNARAVLEERAIEELKVAYQKKYPGIPMQFSAKVHPYRTTIFNRRGSRVRSRGTTRKRK